MPDAWAKTLKVILHTSSFIPSNSTLNPNNSTSRGIHFFPSLLLLPRPTHHHLLRGQLQQSPGLSPTVTVPPSNPTCCYTASVPCGQEICPLHLEYNAKASPGIVKPLSLHPCFPPSSFFAHCNPTTLAFKLHMVHMFSLCLKYSSAHSSSSYLLL